MSAIRGYPSKNSVFRKNSKDGIYSFYAVILWRSRGAKDLPVTNAQAPHDGFSFLTAKLWVCIHRGHQDGGILIVLSLFSGQSMGIDVNISCESNVVIVVDQNDFTGQVSAFSFIHLKMQITEIKEADLR